MEKYQRRLIQKDLLNLNEKNSKHIRYYSEVPSLKIFCEPKIPMIGVPSTASKYEAIQEQRKEQEQLASSLAAAEVI